MTAKTEPRSRLYEGKPWTKAPDPTGELTHRHRLSTSAGQETGARLPQGWGKQQDCSSLHETHILFWAVTQSRETLLQGRETRAPLCRSSRRVLLPNLARSPVPSRKAQPSAGCLPTSAGLQPSQLGWPFYSQSPFSVNVPAAPLPGWAMDQVTL